MGIIEKELEVEGYKNRQATKSKAGVLFDTGSTASFVNAEIAEKLSRIVELNLEAHLGELGKTMDVKGVIGLKLKLNGVDVPGVFWVTDKLRHDIVVGVDIMQARKLILDMEKEDIDVSNFRPVGHA